MLTPWLAGWPVDPLLVLLLALAVDAAVGDPPWLYRRLAHPVALLGRLIEAGERRLNDPQASESSRTRRGLVLTIAVVGLAAAVGWACAALLAPVPGGWIVVALLASTLIALRGLYDHARAVAEGLARDLAEGRAAVAHIVGRDPASLDEAGVARAAVESLAENFSDGLVAPAFWFALLGLPGLCAYKAVNTLDSMIGHRNDRYLAFGRAAARLDDAVNWLPARLAGVLIVAAACLRPDGSGRAAWRVMLRDAPKHRSPNAGWQEAAYAGALGLALAGPRQYGGKVVEDHWMGDGRTALDASDVERALGLYVTACAVTAALVAVLWLVL